MLDSYCNGNAHRIQIGNIAIFISYKTVVGFYTVKTGRVFCENVWSNTTGKHLNAFGSDKKDRVKHDEFLKMWKKIETRLEKIK